MIKTIIRVLAFLVVFAGLILGGFVLVSQKKQQLKQAPKFGLSPKLVTVTTATKGTFTQKRNYLAVVEPAQTVQITARVTAIVEEVLCDEGEWVEAGAVLVKLDREEARHRIHGVEAQIEQAKAELAANKETISALEHSLQYFKAETRRYKQLAEGDAVPESQAEKASEMEAEIQGNLDSAKKRSVAIKHRIISLEQKKEELKTRLGYYIIRSPFDGVISDRMVDTGDLASPNKVLVEMEDRGALKLCFDIPQKDLPAVKQGLPVHFSVKGTRKAAKISLMHPSLDQAHMMRAEVHLSPDRKDGVLSGAYMPVSVVVDEYKNAILIPRTSLIESSSGNRYVFAVKQNKLVSYPAQVLGFTNDQAAVKGVTAGMQLVRNTYLGWAQLSSGEKVEAVE